MSIGHKRALKYTLVIPLVFFILMQAMHFISGPIWRFSDYDPDYAYLMNSVNSELHRDVGHTDHPGTLLQTFGGLVLTLDRMIEFSGNQEAQIANLLNNPEKFLTLLIEIILVIYTLALSFAGYVVLSKAQNLLSMILVPLTPLYFAQITTTNIFRFNPEPIVSIFSTLLGALSFKKSYEGRTDKNYELISGALLGFGIATKITILPLMILPLFILSTKKEFAQYFACIAVFFYIGIYPILNQFHGFSSWVMSLATHKGAYGTGPTGLIDLYTVKSFLPTLLTEIPLYIFALFVSGFVVISRKRTIQEKALYGFFVSCVAQMLMVLKHPGIRYLCPSLALAGFMIVLSMSVLGERVNKKNLKMGFIVVFMALIIFNSLKLYEACRVKFRSTGKILAAESYWEKNHKDSATLSFMYSSSPRFALAFGEAFAKGIYGRETDKMYSDIFSWDLGSESIWNASRDKITIGELKEKFKHILVKGPPFVVLKRPLPQGWLLKLLYEDTDESIFELFTP
jgi:hypothetical protein